MIKERVDSVGKKIFLNEYAFNNMGSNVKAKVARTKTELDNSQSLATLI